MLTWMVPVYGGKALVYRVGTLGAYITSNKGVPINSRWFGTKMSKLLKEFPEVDIDTGVFKYMLLKIHDKSANDSKTVVRGYISAAWHDDIYEQTNEQMKKYAEIEVKSLGGGRIKHDAENKIIQIYGYSQGYGLADHKKSADLLKKKYPDYDITWSNERCY